MTRRLRLIARRSRKATAAQHQQDIDLYLWRLRMTPPDPDTQAALADRFKDVTP